jgi:thiamine-phosphate pyrophosphorylase
VEPPAVRPTDKALSSTRTLHLPRLYAILDVDLAHQRDLDPELLCADWLDAGVRLIQLRAKSLPGGAMLALAGRLSARARPAGATFIVNDRLDIALLAGADGVHVGQEDLTPSEVRRACAALPGLAVPLIGLSTHNDAQLQSGLDEPVSYLAIGPVFATVTKAQPDPIVGLSGVTRAQALIGSSGMPLVAIGGIDETNARAVIDAGADTVAVASGLVRKDAGARARALLAVIR